jgi:hypothetical protein
VTGPSPGEPPADLRDALIREQTERLAEQERRLAAQAEQIAALEAMVADLRDRLAAAERAGSRNSGNSSMLPSADDLPGRKPPAKQGRAAARAEKKMRGKQPGSPGASMPWQVPDRIEDHYPEGSCPCGRHLADAADLGVARSFLQEEIPAAPAQRDLHERQCACGRTHVAPRPAGVPDSARSPSSIRHSGSAPGARRRWPTPGSCRASLGSGSPTGTRTTSTPGGSTSPGNQSCLAHLLRDFEDCAESYPGAIWPV